MFRTLKSFIEILKFKNNAYRRIMEYYSPSAFEIKFLKGVRTKLKFFGVTKPQGKVLKNAKENSSQRRPNESGKHCNF